MRVQDKQDMRTVSRRPFQSAVQVSWQARSGETRVVQGKMVDLSEHGARIECQEPFDVRTSVFLRAPAYGLMGTASVRYCRRSGLKHIVGLLFNSAASQADQGRKRLNQAPRGEE